MVHKTPNANRGYRDSSKIEDAKPKKPKGKSQPPKKPRAAEAESSKAVKGVSEAPRAPEALQEALQEQQLVLDVFRNTFNAVLSSTDNLNKVLQEIKQALFNREFERAFAKEEYLEAYAARWSPTRAMCYERALHRPAIKLDPQANHPGWDPKESLNTSARKLKVVSIGGGAAELVAFAAFLRGAPQQDTSGELLLIDSAPWKFVVEKLYSGLTTPPPVSHYASAAVKETAAAASPFISADRLSVTFEQRDALSLTAEQLESLLGEEPLLVTLCFTLNELFTSGGLGATTRFLMNLTSALPSTSLLLVVDSAGSYSEVGVGSQARRYPMQWLLDRVLTGKESSDTSTGKYWTKLDSDDSVWFRLKLDLEYPIQLENMRYQVHVYHLNENGKEASPSVDSNSTQNGAV